MNSTRNILLFTIVVVGLVGSLALAAPVFAQTNIPQGAAMGYGRWEGGMRGGRANGVFGTVSTLNGNTLTVTQKTEPNGTTGTTYTVDATNAQVTKNGTSASVSSIAVGDTVMVQGTVSGTSITATTIRDGIMMGPGKGRGPGINGTVTAVNGNTITVTQKTGPNATTTTTYTVDATNAKVLKNGTSSTVSNIAVGDMVMVQGTVNGTNVTATMIRDGIGRGQGWQQQTAAIVQGNGQPVIAGSVTAINGNTLTVTNKSNVTYTVDASSAKIAKGGASVSLASVATGDSVIVQGTVNGTSVTASSVIDQGAAPSTGGGNTPQPHVGFFGMIGNFFAHLFGF